jgi:ubiquinone/menaquinone biosynthesis C-methylase UbiE
VQTIRLDSLQLHPHHRVLDLGCGEGRHALAAYWFGAAHHVVAVDLSERDVITARSRHEDFAQNDPNKHLNIFVSDGLKLPFADASFDVVICSEVLEHIPAYQAMLAEAKRVLKGNGILAISVPRAWPERICWWLSSAYHQVEGGHIRIFQAAALRDEIEKLGFRCFQQHGAHALHVPYWWLRCLFWHKGADFAPVRWYHRMLVWDLLRQPRLTRILDTLLNPVMGKSVVFYFIKDST